MIVFVGTVVGGGAVAINLYIQAYAPSEVLLVELLFVSLLIYMSALPYIVFRLLIKARIITPRNRS